MSISIDLPPEAEKLLREKAVQFKMSPESFALEVLTNELTRIEKLDDQLQKSLRIIESFRGKMGSLPPGADSRESIYEDRY